MAESDSTGLWLPGRIPDGSTVRYLARRNERRVGPQLSRLDGRNRTDWTVRAWYQVLLDKCLRFPNTHSRDRIILVGGTSPSQGSQYRDDELSANPDGLVLVTHGQATKGQLYRIASFLEYTPRKPREHPYAIRRVLRDILNTSNVDSMTPELHLKGVGYQIL